jgi:hypothetical protein
VAVDVEAPVKSVVVFLSGVAIAVAGAFTRSCDAGFSAQMASSWCGDTSLLASSSHAHCAGCAMMAVGGIVIAVAALMHLAGDHVAPATRPIEARR